MIVTMRARWIVLLSLLSVFYAAMRQHPFLLQLAVACILWIIAEWVLFRYRADFFIRAVTANRHVSDRKGESKILWVDRPVTITTTVRFPHRFIGPPTYADVHDLLPSSKPETEGKNGLGLLLGSASEIEFSYRLRPEIVGTMHFPGLRFVLSDLHGFFHAERFLALPTEYRVLPMPAVASGTAATARKRKNLLPPPGIHTLSQSGVGSELLEIRDYVPGDSPRSIAWKVSARRDSLMSKQFESEVPIRCQLFCDLSRSVRLGYPGPCEAQRLVRLSAVVMQMLISHRDPVGMSLFDSHRVKVTPPSANRKTALRTLDEMAKSISAPMLPVDAPASAFLRSAFDVARLRYPAEVDASQSMLDGIRILPRFLKYRMRHRMAALLAAHYDLGPMSIGELVADDHAFSHRLQQFLTAHQIPYGGPILDRRGNYLFDDRDKIPQLANALTTSVRRARDNELYVIMAGLLDTDYDLSPLVQAIKVAKARFHRVILLCAWPPGMKPPTLRARNLLDDLQGRVPIELASAVDRQQKITAFDSLRSELGKLRVPVVAAADATAERLIIRQMELIRDSRATA